MAVPKLSDASGRVNGMDGLSFLLLLTGLLLGLVVGALAAWLVLRSRVDARVHADAATLADLRADASAARSEAAQSRAALADARGEVERRRAELAQVDADQARHAVAVSEANERAARAVGERAQVEARLAAAEAERDAAIARARELAADRDSLVTQFKALSAEQLAVQAKQAEFTAEKRLQATEALMAPVREGLERMNARLTEVEKERSGIAAELRAQVQSVIATGDSLRRETSALVTALRKPQVRGAWGETQLRRVAEITGMVERCDFEVQVSAETDDGRRRPDMRVHLADGKVVFVDSKVPLSAFMDAFDTDDEERRTAHLDTFARHVRTHIEQLSSKAYWQLDHGSPEFVVLFLPSEAFLQAAVEHAGDLHEFAVRRNIVLATPSILIPLLRAVGHGWKQAALAESAAEVAALGRELHTRLGTLGSNFDKLGRSLTGAVKAYNSTLGSLEGRVLVTARKFEDLDVTSESLGQPQPSAESVRVITAPELVDSAAEFDTTLGRLPRHERPTPAAPVAPRPDLRDDERRELTRGEPTLDELIADEATPALLDLTRHGRDSA